MTAPSPVYCDYNATSPLRPSARTAMAAAMESVGNPSSVHGFGRAIRRTIEEARKSIIQDLGLPDYRVVFTSGATEALATALAPATTGPKPGRTTTRLFVAGVEHVAALQGHGFHGQAVTVLDCDHDGLVRIDVLRAYLEALPETERALVCVQAANNETGVLQPIEAISTLCDVHGALFVCDMVQLAGRQSIGGARPAVAIVSGHKIGGPAGVGALIYDPQRAQLSHPLIRGGGQERGVRAGTENHIGIVGFAAALSEAIASMAGEQVKLATLRDTFEARLLAEAPDTHIFGSDAPRLSNTSCFALSGRSASLALMQLDLAGVAVSSGSACSSGKVKQSHVLAAMGVESNIAECALRMSLGFDSTEEDVERLVTALFASSDGGFLQSKSSHVESSKRNSTFASSAIGISA